MEAFKEFIKQKKIAETEAQKLIGKTVVYNYSGHVLEGEVTRVHGGVDQVKIKNHKTGKEYWVFWGGLIGVKDYE